MNISKINLSILFTIFFLPLSSFALSEEQQLRVDKISSQLMCVVCEGQTIASSDSKLAKEMKDEITRQIEQGKSNKEILDFFAEKYGDKILTEPKFNLLTAFLWTLPLLAIIVGGVIIFVRYR